MRSHRQYQNQMNKILNRKLQQINFDEFSNNVDTYFRNIKQVSKRKDMALLCIIPFLLQLFES